MIWKVAALAAGVMNPTSRALHVICSTAWLLAVAWTAAFWAWALERGIGQDTVDDVIRDRLHAPIVRVTRVDLDRRRRIRTRRGSRRLGVGEPGGESSPRNVQPRSTLVVGPGHLLADTDASVKQIWNRFHIEVRGDAEVLGRGGVDGAEIQVVCHQVFDVPERRLLHEAFALRGRQVVGGATPSCGNLLHRQIAMLLEILGLGPSSEPGADPRPPRARHGGLDPREAGEVGERHDIVVEEPRIVPGGDRPGGGGRRRGRRGDRRLELLAELDRREAARTEPDRPALAPRWPHLGQHKLPPHYGDGGIFQYILIFTIFLHMNDDVNVAVGGGSEPLRAIDRRRGIPLHAILDNGMEARNIEGPEIADIIEGDRSQGTELDGGGIDPELDPVCAIARDDHQGGRIPWAVSAATTAAQPGVANLKACGKRPAAVSRFRRLSSIQLQSARSASTSPIPSKGEYFWVPMGLP